MMEHSAFLLIFVIGGIHTSLAQDCQYDQIRQCYFDLSQTIDTSLNYYELCGADAGVIGEIVNCMDPIGTTSCSEQQLVDLNRDLANTQEALATKCDALPTTTTTPPPPPPVACNTDGWKKANAHMENCITKYKTLDRFEHAMLLTKYGICRNVQAILDCMFEDEQLNKCTNYKEAFGRELISYISLGHLFGCKLTLQGDDVVQRNPSAACNIWDWLTCHDSLFEQLPGLSEISEDTDLNAIMDYNVPSVTVALLTDRSICSDYSTVEWSTINRCRNSLSDKCKLLKVPRQDGIWFNVIDLMTSLKTGIYDKIAILVRIQEICAPGCDNLLTRRSQIDTVCKENAGKTLPTQIMTKFNQGTSITAECSKLDTMNSCLNTVRRDCPFLDRSIAFNLHNDNAWNLAFDICKTDIQVQSDGQCTSEDIIANKILTDCSFQWSSTNRADLLTASYSEEIFCIFLQQATNCYAQNVKRCPALERKYWSAELPLMYAANQMISQCHVAYSTYGGLEITAVDQSKCDMTRWVGCLGDLWKALGVTTSANKLDVAGFRALLALVWNEGDKTVVANRCMKVRGLDYGSMETCVTSLSLDCQYPMLTLSDGQTYEQKLRDPFNIKTIREFVMTACSLECTDADIGADVKNCLNIENDLTIIGTYPKDIIISAFVNKPEEAKCKTVEEMKACVLHHLDPTKCRLYRPTLVQNPVFKVALGICKNPPTLRDDNDDDDGPTTGASAATASTIFILLAALFSYVM